MGRGFRGDGETGSWHHDARAAGPAGAVALDLPVGIRVVVDRAQPTILLGIAVYPVVAERADNGVDQRELEHALLALRFPPEAAAVLSRPAVLADDEDGFDEDEDEGGADDDEALTTVDDDPIEVDLEVVPLGLRRLLGELAILDAESHDLGEERDEVLAIAQLERAWLELRLPPALRDDDDIEVTVGAGLSWWSAASAGVLGGNDRVPLRELIYHLTDLQDHLHLTFGEDAPLSIAFDRLLDAVIAAEPAPVGAEPTLHAPARDRQTLATLGVEDLFALISQPPWAEPDVDPIGTILHLVAPAGPEPAVVTMVSDGDTATFSVDRAALGPMRPWISVFDDDGTLLAARPMEADGPAWRTSVATTAPVPRAILAAGPENRRPPGPSALSLIETAIRDGRSGIEREVQQFPGSAAEAWLRCGARWLMLGDGRRCATALTYAVADLEVAGRNDDEVAAIRGLARALATEAIPSRDRTEVLVWKRVRLALEGAPDR